MFEVSPYIEVKPGRLARQNGREKVTGNLRNVVLQNNVNNLAGRIMNEIILVKIEKKRARWKNLKKKRAQMIGYILKQEGLL